MREVSVVGAGMVKFGKYLNTSMKVLARDAINNALASAGLEQKQIQAAAVGNAIAGLVTGQECIRGQVMLRSMGIGGIPVVKCENACASASTALNQACAMVSGDATTPCSRSESRSSTTPTRRKSSPPSAARSTSS